MFGETFRWQAGNCPRLRSFSAVFAAIPAVSAACGPMFHVKHRPSTPF
jgi:hypothetical protein